MERSTETPTQTVSDPDTPAPRWELSPALVAALQRACPDEDVNKILEGVAMSYHLPDY